MTQYECPSCQRVTDEWKRDGLTLRLYCVCGIIICYPSGRYHRDDESVLHSKRRGDHD